MFENFSESEQEQESESMEQDRSRSVKTVTLLISAPDPMGQTRKSRTDSDTFSSLPAEYFVPL